MAAGILACSLFAAGVLTGTVILDSSKTSNRHSQAFKTSIMLHKASCRVMHGHDMLLRAQGFSRQALACVEVASGCNGSIGHICSVQHFCSATSCCSMWLRSLQMLSQRE